MNAFVLEKIDEIVCFENRGMYNSQSIRVAFVKNSAYQDVIVIMRNSRLVEREAYWLSKSQLLLYAYYITH